MGLVLLTGAVVVLYLDANLRLVGREGSGWRTLDLEVLRQRIETGELRDREADWYHPASDEERQSIRGHP